MPQCITKCEKLIMDLKYSHDNDTSKYWGGGGTEIKSFTLHQ